MKRPADQFPRLICPGISIMTATLTPESSTSPWRPSSILIPAQVWHCGSVGGCLPNDSTQGQNTVQLQDNISSPLMCHNSRPAISSPDQKNTTSNDQSGTRAENEWLRRRQRFLQSNENSDACHPQDVHHASCKHQQHQRPAAGQAQGPLLHAHLEHLASLIRPMRQKITHRGPAL